MLNLHAIVPAAGSGQRFGGELPKQFMLLAGKTVLAHAIEAMLADPRVSCVHVAGCGVHAAQLDAVTSALSEAQRTRVQVHTCGGATRAMSVLGAAQQPAARQAEWLLVHDAARPCLHAKDLARVIDQALQAQQPALLATPLAHTLKLAVDGRAVDTVPRNDKWLAQTPQLAPADVLRLALQNFPEATDEAEALEKSGYQPQLVAAEHPNPKLTTHADLMVIESLIAGRNC